MVRGPRRDELIEQVWTAFRRSERTLHSRARAGAASGGLTLPRVTLLRLVVHREKASSRDLAEALNVSTADLPGLLEKLESDGLVTRRRDPSDRRVVYVRATPRGRRKLRALWRAAMRALAVEFESWSESDLRALCGLLSRLGPGPLCDLSVPRLRARPARPLRAGRAGRPPTTN